MVAGAHYHSAPTSDGVYRRLPLPFATLVITLGAPAVWRTGDGEWVAFPEIALRGPATRWSLGFDADGPLEYVVALIEPWAVDALFGIAAPDACNAVVDVRQLWTGADLLVDEMRSADQPRRKVEALVRALRARALHKTPNDRLPSWFVENCRSRAGGVSPSRAAAERDCSERWLRSRIHSAVGMSPKRWARLERFSATLRQLHANPWRVPSQFARPDYYDQSHQIREFRQLAGMTPGRYRALKATGDRRVFVTSEAPAGGA
jgi:AraC-like DNA-binding protein